MTMQIRKAERQYALDKARAFDPALYDRIMANLDAREPYECWVWKRPLFSKAHYPQIRNGGKKLKVHRLFFEMFFRLLLPGECVLHSCDNPACCNPVHLHAGSHQDNMRQRTEKNRGADLSGENNGRAKLTKEDVAYILSSTKGCAELGRSFGVTRQAIHRIKKNINWKKTLGGNNGN